MKKEFFNAARPLVFGHRGAAGDMPENTIPSFDRALKDGADVLETDIHITKDGVLVISHDEELNRCTNGVGAIHNLTLAEIKQFDAGYTFTPDGGKTYPYRGQGITVPTLEEVFQRYPTTRFNIDMKVNNLELIKKFADLIKKYNRADITIAGSFDHRTIEAFRAYTKEIGINVLTCASNAEITAVVISSKTPLKQVVAMETPVQKARVKILSESFVKAMHAQGHAVVPWTINDPEEMKKLLAMGIDGIITNFPGKAAAIIKNPPPTP